MVRGLPLRENGFDLKSRRKPSPLRTPTSPVIRVDAGGEFEIRICECHFHPCYMAVHIKDIHTAAVARVGSPAAGRIRRQNFDDAVEPEIRPRPPVRIHGHIADGGATELAELGCTLVAVADPHVRSDVPEIVSISGVNHAARYSLSGLWEIAARDMRKRHGSHTVRHSAIPPTPACCRPLRHKESGRA